MNHFVVGLFLFLVAYQLKHFLADYILQGQWMLRKFEAGFKKFFLPLATHCLVHAAMTFGLVLLFTWSADGFVFPALMAGLDFCAHFVMDRIKAGPDYLGRFKPLAAEEYGRCKFVIATEVDAPERVDFAKKRIRGNKYFWWSLGLDQMVHHLTHYAIVFLTVLRW